MPQTNRTATGVLGGLAGLVGLSALAGILVTATVTPAIAVTSNAASTAITMFDNLPSYLDIDDLMLPTTIYTKSSKTGKWVELTQFYDQNRSPVDFNQITPVMYDAILSSEDPRFYEHGGVDLIGTSRAILTNLRGNSETQGGSSISQQYVKNVLVQKCERNAETPDAAQECWFEAVRSDGNEGIQRKLQEMRYAIALEQRYSKNEILLGYLNIANFGGLTYGIDAAARYYFGVPSSKLTIGQAATLAGIVQNPNSYRIDQPEGSIADADGNLYNKAPDGSIDDVNSGQLAALDTLLKNGTITDEQYLAAADGYSATKGRQLYVLSRMLDDGKITQEQYVEAVVAPIEPDITAPKTGCVAAKSAAYFCQYVKGIIQNDEAFGATREDRLEKLKRGGLNIYTTLDWRIQNPAQKAMADATPTKISGMSFGAAAVSVEASTGRVLAMVQNTKFSEDKAVTDKNRSYTSLVYAGNAKYGNSIGFPVGSTFKLFTLLDWLDKGHSVNEVLNGRVKIIPRMTNSCAGDWVNVSRTKIGNFGGGGGVVGTPMYFTAQSLNSGYLAMAEQLDLCDIGKTAESMGVMTGDGKPLKMDTAFSVLGSNNISPLAMAGAYATVANNGIYCEPKFIDKITDANGESIDPPKTSCKQVLDPKVAATAAYALKGVMQGAGTGARSNPYDGTPLIGKTGTHQSWQTWMVESSTAAATAVWVGNTKGEKSLFGRYYNGWEVSQIRHRIAPKIQGALDKYYKGREFPTPDRELIRQVLYDLPNVVGLSVAEATKKLEDVGFQVRVGDPVDSTEGKGIVARQDPEGGKVAGGTVVTIYPSNGKGIIVPDGLVGMRVDDAENALRSAGFGRVERSCEEAPDTDGVVTRVDPASGTVANRNTRITITFQRDDCDGGFGGP